LVPLEELGIVEVGKRNPIRGFIKLGLKDKGKSHLIKKPLYSLLLEVCKHPTPL
jgi:hypothetical protein